MNHVHWCKLWAWHASSCSLQTKTQPVVVTECRKIAFFSWKLPLCNNSVVLLVVSLEISWRHYLQSTLCMLSKLDKYNFLSNYRWIKTESKLKMSSNDMITHSSWWHIGCPRWNPHDIMVNMLDCHFSKQVRIFASLWLSLGKGMTSTRIALTLNNPQRLICH